jgi:hypothetical protein
MGCFLSTYFQKLASIPSTFKGMKPAVVGQADQDNLDHLFFSFA